MGDGPVPGTRVAAFTFATTLPADLPPGLYRLRVDLGAMAGSTRYNLNGYSFASRPFLPDVGSYFYSPMLIPANGTRPSGQLVNASAIQARFPWVLLSNYNSNGYYGAVADEDRSRFALSNRSIIPDDVILPLYDTGGTKLSYSLEPQFPADTIDALQNIPWSWNSGELSVVISGPDGARIDLGTAKFAAKSGNGPTTKNAAFTAWKPYMYGRYTVTATGWIEDTSGRRYRGGGTYRFWIARRMTLATATFQGMPYPVGSSYGRDTQFNPAVPADVQVTVSLYPDSDAAKVKTLSYSGKATPAGLFGAAQGMKSFPLDAPGEYHAQLLATYTDGEGHLWVSTMRHAGVVYADSTAVIARGKKFAVGSKYVDRGETKFEGYIDADGESHLAHLTFPYNSGDVLLVAAEGQGANKIEPVLTYQMQGDTSAWDTSLNGVGTTNLRIQTSNGYSPHLYPEYITTMEYYYGAAPRPGFMGRFLVGESNVRAPYWPVSPNSFGGQIGASPNGDAPGDIYRLLGGVVLGRPGQARLYAGYISSAFLLARGSNNNRVIAPGAEDLNGPLGEKARFYLVGLRPGTAYAVGATFRPAVQIDPLLPVSIRFTLTYPDGRKQVAEGTGDRFGSFAGSTSWPLDVGGVYTYQLRATWNGYEGRMPGLPDSGGEFFVYSPAKPAGASGLQIDGASQRTFSATTGAVISGTTSAALVHYTLITPGAVIEQGDLQVKGGRFQYTFDPVAVHAKVPLYDVTSITTGKPQIGRVIHLTFFSEEKTASGSFFDVSRVILRGTTALAAKPAAAAKSAIGSLSVDPLTGRSALENPDGSRRQAGPVTMITRSASALRAWDGWVDALVRSGDLVVTSTDGDTILTGRMHERLQQFYKGVPVIGGDLARQLENGATVSVFGTVYTGIELDIAPAIGAEDAARAAARATGGQVPPGDAPALAVLPLDGGGYALAWQAETRSATDVRMCFVDAATGQVLLDYSNLKAEQAQGARQASRVAAVDLGGDAPRTELAIGGSAAYAAAVAAADGENPASADEFVRAAQAGIASTRDYFVRRAGQFSLDRGAEAIPVVVHPVSLSDWARLGATHAIYFAGAFWDGRMVVLGEGTPRGALTNGRAWVNAASALDLVAHELTHALIDQRPRFIYRGESGALAEAFADMMATSVEFASQPAGPGVAHADYLVGEDATEGGVRSLGNPSLHGNPDHRSQFRTDGVDGGVHANSTIASHAFYLAIEGGTNRTSGASVNGVGAGNRNQIERAFYRAFVDMLPSGATFGAARAATIQSARDLFGQDSAAERAIMQAWTAVGVR
jgi:Zn-dependent metalloprotease